MTVFGYYVQGVMKSFIRITMVAITLLLSVVAFCYPQTSAMEIHAMGLEYAVQGKFEEAKEKFQKALQLDPLFESARTALELIENVSDQEMKRETAIHHFKSDAYIIKQRWNEAITESNKAIETDAEFALAYINRGIAYVGKGDYDLAIDDCSKAIEINSALPGFYLSRGLAYTYKADYDEAISDFNKAIELNPNEAMGYYSRGIAYQGKSQHEEAIFDFDRAIALHPGEAAFYSNRGTAWYHRGEYAKAVADYTKALDIDPHYTEAYDQLSWILATCPYESYQNGTKKTEPTQGASGVTLETDLLDGETSLTPGDPERPIPRLETIKVNVGNIRAEPTTESSIIGKLTTGTEVELIYQEDEWYAVKLPGGKLGWAHQSLFLKSD